MAESAHCGFTDANFQQPKKTPEEFRADQTMQNMAERVQFMNLLNADEIARSVRRICQGVHRNCRNYPRTERK